MNECFCHSVQIFAGNEENIITFKIFKSDNFKGLSGIWPRANPTNIGDSASPRPASAQPQSRSRSRSWSRGRVSGGDIVDLVLLDTSSVNMKRALFWKRKKSNKRFTNWLQSFHFIKGLDHGTVSIDYTVQCSASSNTRISISISNRNTSAAQAHVWHSAVIYPIRVTCQLSAYIICLHRSVTAEALGGGRGSQKLINVTFCKLTIEKILAAFALLLAN